MEGLKEKLAGDKEDITKMVDVDQAKMLVGMEKKKSESIRSLRSRQSISTMRMAQANHGQRSKESSQTLKEKYQKNPIIKWGSTWEGRLSQS